MTLEAAHEEIERVWPKHLEETRRLLKIPSVSMTGEGIEDMAEALADVLRKLGVKPQLYRASDRSHPLVAGYLDVGAEKTGLLYGMYDVQPVGDLKLWDHPPFDATIVSSPSHGDVVVNRGVYNSKGSLAGTLLAIQSMLDKGAMPVNIHFLLEGEEEIGGRSLPEYILSHKAELSKADVAFGFDYGENSKGTPVIALGMKGCVYFDLVAEGTPETGGPIADEVHSSEAVWVGSPAWRLVQAISTMVNERQEPAIDGFWDDVAEPDEEDMSLIRKLADRFDGETYARDLGVHKFKVEGDPEHMLTKYMFEPSINIDGLLSGYTEEGTKTVLPPRAMAKIDIRTVPNMSVEGTHKKVMDHLKKRGFTDIRMRNYEDYPWSKVSAKEDISRACVEAMRYHGKEPEVWPMVAGSAPAYVFDQVLGVPWGGAGLGWGGKAHAPNEFAVVDGMREFEKSVATVFWKFVEISKNDK